MLTGKQPQKAQKFKERSDNRRKFTTEIPVGINEASAYIYFNK